MADIELVIKIPDAPIQDYQDLLYKIHGMAASEGLFDDKEKSQRALALKAVLDILGGIVNGIPLPKGHGALKDFDKIEWYGCDLEGRGCIEAKGDCSVCNHANCYAKQVRELPTIIEADKESEI